MIDTPRIIVVGLGPSGLDAISRGAFSALQKAPKVFVRTNHHPAVAEFSDCGIVFESFDHLYESAESFEQVYEGIAVRIISEAGKADVAYAVPGHPLVGERSVEITIERAKSAGIPVQMEPSPSFVEACLEALQVSMDAGLKILDALQVEQLTPSLDTPNLVYQVYDQGAASRTKLRLMEFFPDEHEVFLIRGAGTGNAVITQVPLYELDRHEVDHLTSVYVPKR